MQGRDLVSVPAAGGGGGGQGLELPPALHSFNPLRPKTGYDAALPLPCGTSDSRRTGAPEALEGGQGGQGGRQAGQLPAQRQAREARELGQGGVKRGACRLGGGGGGGVTCSADGRSVGALASGPDLCKEW